MAKSIHDDVLDGALNVIKNNCTRMVLCSAEPTSFAEANSTYALGDVTMASGDFTLANGDTSGRKVTVSAKSAVPIDATGTGNHIGMLDVANSKLLATTTCAPTAVTSGGTVDISSFKFELADPA